jgi:hypothetical protein
MHKEKTQWKTKVHAYLLHSPLWNHLKILGVINIYNVATLLWKECKDETHTPEMGTWESSGTPESLEFDYKGQNTLHWGVLYIIGKLSKCKCPKWARMTHLDIWNTSYGQKKGRELVWLPTTESRELTRFPCVQVACDTSLESSWRGLQLWFRPRPDQRSAPEVIVLQSYGTPSLGDFKTPIWESRDKKPFGYHSRGMMQSILYGGRWWFPPSPGRGESCESRVVCGLS